MQFNEKRMLDRLMEMIRIDSPSFEEKPMTDYLEKYFWEFSWAVSWGSKGILISSPV